MDKEQLLKISKTHHLMPPVVYGLLALLMTISVLYRESLPVSKIISLLIGGALSWTLIEYLLHRFSFHIETKNERLKLWLAGLHLLHHEIPNRADYVVAPLLMSLPLYLFILGISALITRDLSVTGLWGSGIALGYLTYEWIHYATHHRPAKTKIMKYLKRHHLLHHFKDSNSYFGVSSPFWDIVFDTKPEFDPSRESEILPITSRARS